MTAHSTVPLFALDAVVFDTETTGLDPARARVVEIGALRLKAGKPVEAGTFRRLVDPGMAIPASATAIHGIDAKAVAGAPPFAKVWPEFLDWAGGAVLIGHSIGFDLAICRAECERAALKWTPPRTLCVRLLAELCAPNLAGFDIEQLAAWLGVAIEGRHSAAGDALTTARLFAALLPKLRDNGIRTLAEAERAAQRLTHVLDEHHRAGWVAPAGPAADDHPLRTDLAPYLYRARDVMNAPVVVEPSITLQQALAEMTQRRISSLLVRRPDQPGGLGIMTERDAMRALNAHGTAALTEPIASLVSAPLHAVAEDSLIQRAIGRMSRLRIRHLAVTAADGSISGIVSARDLLRLRARDAVWLGDEIDSAPDVAALAKAWARLPQVVRALKAEGIAGAGIAALVSEELRALTARAAQLAEQAMRERGEGPPPCRYAVAVLGSAGRGESLLAMDQDNAIVFEHGEPGGAADRWFAALGAQLADTLHTVGVPYCPGGVMAKNPQWRGALATWRHRLADWVGKSRGEDLLAVDIFFDLRGVHGDLALADTVWREGFDVAAGNVGFAKLLIETAGAVEPGLGLFNRLLADNGRTDIKKRGLFGLVSAARALAIAHHVDARATTARLDGLIAEGHGRAELEALREAHAVFLDLLAGQQIADLAAGIPASNTVELKSLSEGEREKLRHAFGAVAHLDELTRELLFPG